MKDVFSKFMKDYEDVVARIDSRGNATLYSKMTREFLESLEGFTIDKLDFYDGYFVIPKGTNAVVEISFKECPGWLFGIWYEEIRNNVFSVDIFSQYEKVMDSFKPSTSYFRQHLECNRGMSINDSDVFQELSKMFNHIKNDPEIAFYESSKHKKPESIDKAEKLLQDTLDNIKAHEKLAEDVRERDLEFLRIVRDMFEGAKLIDLGSGIMPRYEIFVPHTWKWWKLGFRSRGRYAVSQFKTISGYENLEAIYIQYNRSIEKFIESRKGYGVTSQVTPFINFGKKSLLKMIIQGDVE